MRTREALRMGTSYVQNEPQARSWGCERNKIFEKGLPVQELGPQVARSCGRPDQGQALPSQPPSPCRGL